MFSFPVCKQLPLPGPQVPPMNIDVVPGLPALFQFGASNVPVVVFYGEGNVLLLIELNLHFV